MAIVTRGESDPITECDCRRPLRTESAEGDRVGKLRRLLPLCNRFSFAKQQKGVLVLKFLSLTVARVGVRIRFHAADFVCSAKACHFSLQLKRGILFALLEVHLKTGCLRAPNSSHCLVSGNWSRPVPHAPQSIKSVLLYGFFFFFFFLAQGLHV